MSEDFNKSESNIISTSDLGNGRKEVTFRVDSSSLQEYLKDAENVTVGDEFKLGRGSVVSRYDSNTRSQYYFTSNENPYTQVFNNLPADPHKKIKLAVELYFKEPIVGSVIDMMVDFSQSGFTNECDDLEIKKIFDKWCTEININELLEKIFLEYYRSGNVTIYRNQENAKVRKKRKAKDGGTIDITEYQFPSGYSILNPMNVYINNSLVGKPVVQLKVTNELQNLINSPDSTNNYLIDVPFEIIRDVRSGNMFVTLNPQFTSRITRKKQDYERYASPFLERVFEPIMYKQKLRMMDMATIEGLINQLVTVTVGDKDFPATDEDLKAIAELFQTPNKAYTIFWNHTLNVTFHKPEGLDTLTAEKYSQVNDDILAGLGISRALLDGGGNSGSLSSSWVSILSLIERLENARSKVQYWIESEYRRIAQENGFKTSPSVRFNKMNLREDTYIANVLLAMYDRGLIDEEDILTETGRDFQSVVDMKKRNDKYKDLFLPPEQPFQGGSTEPKTGRPSGGGTNKYKKRTTTPEPNSGKAPKPKTSKATASYSKEEEDYATELISQYTFIQSEVADIVDKHKDEDDKIKKILIASALYSLFKTLGTIGYKYISQVFDEEVSSYSDSLESASINATKSDLKSWNDSYIAKLANDITSEINDAIANGKPIDGAVADVFDANQYRINLISQSGIVESTRQAGIVANTIMGKSTATWITRMDDKTCATCKGLHGRQFAIANVPPRPHSGCRCSLEYN